MDDGYDIVEETKRKRREQVRERNREWRRRRLARMSPEEIEYERARKAMQMRALYQARHPEVIRRRKPTSDRDEALLLQDWYAARMQRYRLYEAAIARIVSRS